MRYSNFPLSGTPSFITPNRMRPAPPLLAHLCPPSPIENPRILRRHVFAVIGSLYVCRTRTIFLASNAFDLSFYRQYAAFGQSRQLRIGVLAQKHAVMLRRQLVLPTSIGVFCQIEMRNSTLGHLLTSHRRQRAHT